MATVDKLKADIWGFALLQRETWVCLLYKENGGAALLVETWQFKEKRNKLVELKALVDRGLIVPIWKM